MKIEKKVWKRTLPFHITLQSHPGGLGLVTACNSEISISGNYHNNSDLSWLSSIISDWTLGKSILAYIAWEGDKITRFTLAIQKSLYPNSEKYTVLNFLQLSDSVSLKQSINPYYSLLHVFILIFNLQQDYRPSNVAANLCDFCASTDLLLLYSKDFI